MYSNVSDVVTANPQQTLTRTCHCVHSTVRHENGLALDVAYDCQAIVVIKSSCIINYTLASHTCCVVYIKQRLLNYEHVVVLLSGGPRYVIWSMHQGIIIFPVLFFNAFFHKQIWVIKNMIRKRYFKRCNFFTSPFNEDYNICYTNQFAVKSFPN